MPAPLDEADDAGPPPGREDGRRSRMPLYIASSLLLVLAVDLLVLLLRT